MFDDSNQLVEHVRSCFIRGDESGHCEQALDENSRSSYSPPVSMPDSDDLKDGFGNRFSKNALCQVYFVNTLSEPEDLSSIVIPNDFTKTSENTTCLSDLLKVHFSNPFSKYSRYSAKLRDSGQIAMCPNVKTFTISIYLTSDGRPVDNGSLTVHANVTNAKIVDFIGLILWQYFEEKREPFLTDFEIDHYALLSMDDLEVDFSMPSFDPLEPLSKYGFSSMALVNVFSVCSDHSARPTRLLPSRITVTMTHFNFGVHEFIVNSKDVTLSELIDMYFKRVAQDMEHSKSAFDKAHFSLEAESQPGILIDKLDTTTLSRVGCYNFTVHRKHCNLSFDDSPSLRDMSPRHSSDLLPHGRIFNVIIERSRGRTVEVELVIDTDVIHLNQKEPGTSKSTPTSIFKATIESCRLIGTDAGAAHEDTKQGTKVQLAYRPTDNKTKIIIMRVAEHLQAMDIVVSLHK